MNPCQKYAPCARGTSSTTPIVPSERSNLMPSHNKIGCPRQPDPVEHMRHAFTITCRPAASTTSMIASPAWVPATFSNPARAPLRRLLAIMTVTVGPGTMMMANACRHICGVKLQRDRENCHDYSSACPGTQQSPDCAGCQADASQLRTMIDLPPRMTSRLAVFSTCQTRRYWLRRNLTLRAGRPACAVDHDEPQPCRCAPQR
jgi:hypothetical protein